MKEIHLNRFNKLINYIENKPEVCFTLKRKEIADIVGVSEGDSLKMIFKLLENNKDLFLQKFNYEKVQKTHNFTRIKKNRNKNIELLHLKLNKEIDINDKILLLIKKVSKDDLDFCKKEFKNELIFIETFKQLNLDEINISNESIYQKELSNKIEDIQLINNTLKLYHIISE